MHSKVVALTPSWTNRQLTGYPFDNIGFWLVIQFTPTCTLHPIANSALLGAQLLIPNPRTWGMHSFPVCHQVICTRETFPTNTARVGFFSRVRQHMVFEMMFHPELLLTTRTLVWTFISVHPQMVRNAPLVVTMFTTDCALVDSPRSNFNDFIAGVRLQNKRQLNQLIANPYQSINQWPNTTDL